MGLGAGLIAYVIFLIFTSFGVWGGTGDFWWGVQIFVYGLAFLALFLIYIWESAKSNGLYIFVERNWIVAIDSGEGNPIKVLTNLPDNWHANEKNEIVQGQYKRDWLEKRLGLYWKGLPPRSVHSFPFLHERVNPDMTADTKAADWIERDDAPVPTRYLLWDTPHWFRVPGVEFKDGFRADILVEAQSHVVFPLVAIYDRRGKFFDVVNSFMNSAVVSACREMNYQDFIHLDKDSNSMFAQDLITVINKDLPRQSGLELIGCFVYRFDASSKEEELSQRQLGQAKIDLQVAQLKAKGQVADIKETTRILKKAMPNASEEELAGMIRDIAVADRIKDSNVQALGGAGLVLGNQPKKKNGGNPNKGGGSR